MNKGVVDSFTSFLQCWLQRIAVSFSVLSFAIIPAFAECLNNNGDGTHTDPSTGLIWQTCAVGQRWNGQQCTGSPEMLIWVEAIWSANDNRFQDHDDWILPTRNQLSILGATECGLMDGKTFWSASENSSFPNRSYYVNYSKGFSNDYDRSGSYFVRLVRASQSSDIKIFKESLAALKNSFELRNTYEAKLKAQQAYAIEQFTKAFGPNVSSGALKSYIAANEGNDPDRLLPLAKEKLILAEQREYRECFTNAQSSTELTNFISTYRDNDPDGLIPSAKERLVLAEQNECRESYHNAQSSADFANFIDSCRDNDPDNLLVKAEVMKQAAIKREVAQERARQLQEYRDSFKNSYSSNDLDNFISAYRNNDPDKLIPKAEAKKRIALAQERKDAERQRREDEYRRAHACDHLYVGKVVDAPVTGLVSLFGVKSEKAIILGISNRHGVATVRSVNDSNMVGELSCDSLQ